MKQRRSQPESLAHATREPADATSRHLRQADLLKHSMDTGAAIRWLQVV